MIICWFVFGFFSSWMCCYKYTYAAPNTPQISSRQMLRIGKSRRNVYSQLSDTQTTPSPSMILLELKWLYIDGPGPMSDIVTDLQKVIPGNSKLQRAQLMERVFNFFLNHPIKIICVCSLPSVHQEPDHFYPPYIKIIYENQIFFLTRSCSHQFNTPCFHCAAMEQPPKQLKANLTDTIPDAKLVGCPKTGQLWLESPLDL